MAEKNEPKDVIELDEEEEGNVQRLEDVIFKNIGDPIPLKPQPSKFDLQNPPTQPLAVSENPRAIFLAHSEGFYVTRIKDVIDAAKEMKETGKICSIQDLNVVDVQIGKVGILAVSAYSSTLAASVGDQIHLFSTTSLLNKEQKPFFSCSLDDSSLVKDFHWREKKNSYVVLSRNGVLYQGDIDGAFKQVMDNVDAVDWSTGGNLIAVAKKNNLCIFSSQFRERLTMSLSSEFWIHDNGLNCIVKVDSIKWVRRDCIILGCFQITEDSKEVGYYVQMITSRDGDFVKASSKPVLLSFSDVFVDIIDDIVPFGCGPYLFLNYINPWYGKELAVVANRKNTDQHIILFGWSNDDGQKEAALMELVQEDRWLPRIPLQENDDDNLIMGFGVDTVSMCDKVEVNLGIEQREFSPCCILLCLTLDGKLLMFYVASSTENLDPTQVSSDLTDKEEDSLAVVPSSCDSSSTSSRLVEQEVEKIILDAKAQEMNQKEVEAKEDGGILKESNELNDYLKPQSSVDNTFKLGISNSFSASSDAVCQSQAPLQPSPANKELNTLGHLPKSLNEGKQKANLGPGSLQQSSNSQKSSASSSVVHGFDSVVRNDSNLETQKPVFALSGVATGTGTSARNMSSTFPLSYERSKRFTGNIGRDGPLSASSESQGLPILVPSEDLNSRLISSECNKLQQSSSRTGGAVHVPGSESSVSNHPFGNVLNLKDPGAGPQSSISSSGRSTHFGGQRSSTGVGKQRSSTGVGKLEPVPSTGGSLVESHGASMFGNSYKFKLQHTQENIRMQQSSSTIRSEPELSKQFGSVNEMAKELDTLLSYIEGEGGFREACTVSQRNSVLALDQGLESLSDRCRVWKNTIEERLKDIQHLLDKTVQVLARKIYMEGIVKQASDSQYWDLWNRQKLSPELEMRRRQIFQVNQDLTNQIIELEKHFNILEHIRFGENSGVSMDRRMYQTGMETSRNGQSIHRLYSTMNSQLAVAEQLSECLTKQMAVLNIESPSTRRQCVAKELFESIGLSYDDDPFNSPNVKKTIHTPESVKRFPFSSSSVAIKEQSRRNPSSAIKTLEPETARRRRDSLGQSWASFDPPKTTVKRMLLQEESPRSSPGKSSSATSNGFTSQLQPGLRGHTTPLHLLYSCSNKESDKFQFQVNQDNLGKPSKQTTPTSSFNWAKDNLGPSMALKSPTVQATQRSTLPSSSIGVSASSPINIWNNTSQGSVLVSDRSSSIVTHVEKSDYPEVQSGACLKNGVPYQIKATPGSINQGASSNEIFSAPVKNHASSPPFSASSPAINFCDNISQLETVRSKTQAGMHTAAVPLTVAVSSSDTSLPFIPSPTPPAASPNPLLPPASSSFVSFKGVEAIVPSSSSSTSLPSTPSHLSFRRFSLQGSDEPPSPSTSSTPLNSAIHVPPSEPKPLVREFDLNATSQEPSSQPASVQFSLQLETSLTSVAASKVSEEPLSGTQPSLDTTSFTSESTVPLNSQHESLPVEPVEPVQFRAAVSTSTVTNDGKEESLESNAIQEDEMEEEAPDTSISFSLGSLDSFGLGSAPSSATSKTNPFGAPFPSAVPSAASSPSNLTVPSGEMFRPASFSFQPVQPSHPSQPTHSNPFSGGFNMAATSPESSKNAFGQPAQIGAGQQALGSVLGSFGQSRQIGTGLPGAGFGSPSGLVSGGFAAAGKSGGPFGFASGGFGTSAGGFASAATGGGFAGVGSGGGGFAGVASGVGGFAAASAGGGFAGAASAGGGFGAAASGAGGFSAGGGAGGGFGAFSNQQGGGGFSGFGNSSAGSASRPSALFTEMRR